MFDFQMGRGREGPKKFLGGCEGILQTDGYRLRKGGRAEDGACGLLGALSRLWHYLENIVRQPVISGLDRHELLIIL